jgi:hypothetical protein
MYSFLITFRELICTPFQHISLVWGIVPLYVALFLAELTPDKANYRTAIQTGFSFLWAAAQWVYPWYEAHPSRGLLAVRNSMPAINLFVTFLVLAMGVIALYSGLRGRFPRYGKFLGYTRFANYFMITLYPIQVHFLLWTWIRLGAIVLFALPVWSVLHYGLMPLRNRR